MVSNVIRFWLDSQRVHQAHIIFGQSEAGDPFHACALRTPIVIRRHLIKGELMATVPAFTFADRAIHLRPMGCSR